MGTQPGSQVTTGQPIVSNPPSTQLKTWNKTFGGPKDDVFYSAQQTNDGGYIATGYTDSYGSDEDDVWLVKTDASGNELWNRTFGGPNDGWGSSVLETSDGGYILAGWTKIGDCQLFCQYEAYLIKTDANGNKLWNRTYGGGIANGQRGEAGAFSVQSTNDGGYILAGYMQNGFCGSCPDGAWLIKTDSSGNMLWNKLLRPSGPYYSAGGWAKSIQLTNDGGYILAGEEVTPNHYAWLIKTDAEGNMLWDKDFRYGSSECGAFSVQSTTDGGYILAGIVGGEWNIDGSVSNIHIVPGGKGSYGAERGAAWLIKTDANGNELWNRIFNNTYDLISEGAFSVQLTVDGGYILAGRNAPDFPYSSDAWLIKTDSQGNMLWNRTFGGKSFDETYAIQPTKDSGYIVAGTMAGNAWLMKTDPNGNV